MSHTDDTYYIEFFINGIIKIKNSDKQEVFQKLQEIIDLITTDEELNLIKMESNLALASENELIYNLFNPEQEYPYDGEDDLDSN